MYRIDRSLFHITSNPAIRRVAGMRLGRCSDITANDPDFGMTEEEVARYWCERPAFPGWAVPTSATTPATRSCRSEAPHELVNTGAFSLSVETRPVRLPSPTSPVSA